MYWNSIRFGVRVIESSDEERKKKGGEGSLYIRFSMPTNMKLRVR
jgi:hypothetical protein